MYLCDVKQGDGCLEYFVDSVGIIEANIGKAVHREDAPAVTLTWRTSERFPNRRLQEAPRGTSAIGGECSAHTLGCGPAELDTVLQCVDRSNFPDITTAVIDIAVNAPPLLCGGTFVDLLVVSRAIT